MRFLEVLGNLIVAPANLAKFLLAHQLILVVGGQYLKAIGELMLAIWVQQGLHILILEDLAVVLALSRDLQQLLLVLEQHAYLLELLLMLTTTMRLAMLL